MEMIRAWCQHLLAELFQEVATSASPCESTSHAVGVKRNTSKIKRDLLTSRSVSLVVEMFEQNFLVFEKISSIEFDRSTFIQQTNFNGCWNI